MDKKILDVTCGSRSIWFNHNHPAAIYCDKRVEHDTRIWKSTNGQSERTLTVDPENGRVKNDFYATDPDAVRKLLAAHKFDLRKVLEPWVEEHKFYF